MNVTETVRDRISGENVIFTDTDTDADADTDTSLPCYLQVPGEAFPSEGSHSPLLQRLDLLGTRCPAISVRVYFGGCTYFWLVGLL